MLICPWYSCTRCVQDNQNDNDNDNNDNYNDYNDGNNDNNNDDGDNDDNNNDDYRLKMRSIPKGYHAKRVQMRRDVVSHLLNIGDTLCTVDGGELPLSPLHLASC